MYKMHVEMPNNLSNQPYMVLAPVRLWRRVQGNNAQNN